MRESSPAQGDFVSVPVAVASLTEEASRVCKPSHDSPSSAGRLRILFVSRAYPPVTGGIERQNHALAEQLSQLSDLTLIANRRGKRFLPLFLPYAIVCSLVQVQKHDVLLLGDGLLGVIAWILKPFCSTPVACVLHGLDVTYSSRLYQALWVRKFLPRVDRFFPVSRATRDLAIAKALPAERFEVIPNGVDVIEFSAKPDREQVATLLGRDLGKRRLLITVGRLVKRKGIEWFITNVMPILEEDILYVVVGDGPQRGAIEASVRRHGLHERVVLFGTANAEQLRLLYATADLFVQPNIPVPGDVEGFGLVVLEASASSTPVVASRLEGLEDAVAENENGVLVSAMDATQFRSTIQRLMHDDVGRLNLAERARRHVEKRHGWSAVANRYLDACRRLVVR
jgi:phosphatidyl-myo-inositol dimannoside synthase